MKSLIAILALCCAGLAWSAPQPAAGETVLKGEVLEVKEVDSYSYLRLKTADGETVEAQRFQIEPGGKGLNVAVGLHRLGARVHTLIGCGQDQAGGAPPARPHGEATAWVWSEASGWLLVPRDWRVVADKVAFDHALAAAKQDLRGLVPKLGDWLKEILTLRLAIQTSKQAYPGMADDLAALLPSGSRATRN